MQRRFIGVSPAVRRLHFLKRRRVDYGPLLDQQCRALCLPFPVAELKFHPTRRWRFDRAFVAARLAVEIDGGLFIGGRHNRGIGMERDMEKIAAAMLLGWRVLRVSPRHVTSGQAAVWIAALLRG